MEQMTMESDLIGLFHFLFNQIIIFIFLRPMGALNIKVFNAKSLNREAVLILLRDHLIY